MADLQGSVDDANLQNTGGYQLVDDPNANDNGDAGRPSKKRMLADAGDDDDDDEKGGRERRKIDIKFINDKSRRHITFSKRKAGIMKKAYELSVLTGTQVLLLVVSETGLVYTFTTPKLQPLVTKPEGKNLIQSCLNAPSPTGEGNLDDQAPLPESPDVDQTAHQQIPVGMRPAAAPMNPGYPAMSQGLDPMSYQNYLQQQQQQQHVGQQAMSPQGISPQGYPVPPQARMGGGHPGHQ